MRTRLKIMRKKFISLKKITFTKNNNITLNEDQGKTKQENKKKQK